MEPLTPALCRLHGYKVTVWCTPCRRGVQLDLTPFLLANDTTPLKVLFKRMKCDRCGGRASALDVTRMNVGISEVVMKLSNEVPVLGRVDSATGVATVKS